MVQILRSHALRNRPGWQAVALAVSSLAAPGSAAITAPIVAHSLGATSRGYVATILVPFTFADAVCILGAPAAVTYYVARGASIRAVLRAASVLVIPLTSGTYLGLFILTPHMLPKHAGLSTSNARLLALTVPAALMFAMARGLLNGLGIYRPMNRERYFSAVIRILAVITLAIAHRLTVLTTIEAYLMSGVAGSLALLWIAPGRWSRQFTNVRSANLVSSPSVRDFARFSVSSWGTTLASTVNVRLDQLLLIPMVGAKDLGDYAAAVTLAEVPSSMVGAARRVIFRQAAQDQNPETAQRVARILTAAAALGALLLGVTAPTSVHLLLGDSFQGSVNLLRILLLGTVATIPSYILGAGLTGLGRPLRSTAAEALGAAVTCIGLPLSVPLIGVGGAAVTSAAAYTAVLAVRVEAFRKHAAQPWRASLLVRIPDLLWVANHLRGRHPPPDEASREEHRAGIAPFITANTEEASTGDVGQ